MEMTQNNAFYEVSLEEMFFIDGGKWKWKSFGKSILGGAVGGAVTGACAGGVGALPGAGIGAVGGAVTGAATYLVCGWW